MAPPKGKGTATQPQVTTRASEKNKMPPKAPPAPPPKPPPTPAPKPPPAPPPRPLATVSSSSTSPALPAEDTSTPPPKLAPTVTAPSRPADGEGRAYPNAYYDPEPLVASASDAQRTEYAQQAVELGLTTLDTFQDLGLCGEDLWIEFISVFRPHTIKAWDHHTLIRWISMFRRNDVYIEHGRSLDKAQKIVDLLYRKDHIGINGPESTRATNKENQTPKFAADHRQKERVNITIVDDEVQIPNKTSAPKRGPFVHPDRLKLIDRQDTPPTSEDEEKENEREGEKENEPPPPPQKEQTKPSSGDPAGDPPGDDSDDDANSSKRPTFGHSRGLRPHYPSERDDGDSVREQRGLGINGMMKAMIGKPNFSGSWEEDLDTCISVFDTLATMCQLTVEDKFKAIPIMLTGDALSYFSTHAQSCDTFDDAMGLLRSWYNSDDRKARILAKWQSMRLSTAMEEDPDESEVTIFRKFTADLMSLQNQLDKSYHGDQFLRDRLLTAVDIPSIQSSLRDRLPRTSQQAINRIAIQLSDKRKSAGSASACAAEADERAHYSLGKSYGGDAKRPVKKPYRARGAQGWFTGRRLNSNWMRGVKGCFVCGEPHRANTRHSREEVTSAINKLKAKHPSALITVEDLHAVVNMATEDNSGLESEEDGVMWGEDDEESDDPDFIYIAEAELKEIEGTMANNAFVHGLHTDSGQSEVYTVQDRKAHRGKIPRFNGVTLDTAANRRSVMGWSQYRAYQREFGRTIPMRPPRRDVKGIGGKSTSIGEVNIPIPFPDLGIIIDVEFSVLEGETPTLLSNKDMIDNGLDISLQGGYVHIGERQQMLHLENYFYVHRWSASSVPYVFFTEKELRRIHRSFGHPSVSSTHNLLKRASTKPLSKNLRRRLARLAENCNTCRRHAKAPRRFKLTTGSDDLQFNHRVIVDTMFLGGRPVIHLIDEATHFSAAAFLKSQSTEEIWKAILRLWDHTYLGPPDFLAVDQGSGYISKEFRSNAAANDIVLDDAPIETPGAIGLVERYHAPLRAAYDKIRASIDKSESTNEECLRMATYAINSTMGPEGLVPMLLVFGALPRPARSTPAPTQIRRQQAVEDARRAAASEQAKRRIAFALRHPAGPKGKEASATLQELPPGAKVLVYRTKPKKWEGPHTFVSVDGETVVVQTPRGRRIFRSVCVKPFARFEHEIHDGSCQGDEDANKKVRKKVSWEDEQYRGDTTTEESTLDKGEVDDVMMVDGQEDLGTAPRKEKVKPGSKEEAMFAEPRRAELEGLLKNGTFRPIKMEDVPMGTRVFGSRFVDEIKKGGHGLRKKSRLVAQNYADEEASLTAAKAPTVQRYSQRAALSVAASEPKLDPFIRDIIQAYNQAKSKLGRRVFIKAPAEMGLPPGYVLEVVRPLYGIPESGLHWYLTYLDHHLERLNMIRSSVDPCVLVKRSGTHIEGLVLLQVDDSLGFGDEGFLKTEEKESAVFQSKPRTPLTQEPSSFNGITLRHVMPEVSASTPRDGVDEAQVEDKVRKDVRYRAMQDDKITKMKYAETVEEFVSNRALGQYIGVNVRPDICAPIQLLAPGKEPPTKQEFKTLQKITKFLKQTIEQGLDFDKLDMESVRLVLLTDASFANARDCKSQLGYLLLMVDRHDRCNVVHYGSSRCRRVARRVMAAELFALVLGYDYAYVIRDLLADMTGRTFALEALVDSKTVFDVVAKQSQTAERRLQIDVMSLRQSYDEGELERFGWLPGELNAADPLTKLRLSLLSPLYRIMVTNRFSYRPNGWAAPTHEKENAPSVN